jgi:hypothetical protein
MLSQRSARAQLYQAASPDASSESHYLEPTSGTVASQETGRVKSVADSLQAVRDLAGQFPGPPMAFKDQNTLIKPSTWEEVPIAPPTPQALGSPSELQFKFKEEPPHKGTMMLSSDNQWSAMFSSPIPLTDDGSIRSSRQPTLYTVTGTPLRLGYRYSEKPLDPFNDDDEEDVSSSSGPVTVDKEMFSATAPGFRRRSSLQDSEGTRDILDLATALDAGKSDKFQKFQSSRRESLYESGKDVAGATKWIGSRSQIVTPTKLLPQSRERDMNINNLAMPWLKNPRMEEEERGPLKSMSERDIPLYRNVGKAPKRSTPLPIRAIHKRGSMHLKPIIIPPRNVNIPEVVDESEYDSPESFVTEEHTEVSGMRDDIEKGRNYF